MSVFIVSTLLADSIDDAEAKRRGVPVEQVQAENALAAEKRKEATLASQIADAKKRLADMAASSAAAGSKGPASASQPGSSATTVYDDFVARYMAGDWEKLLDDLAAKEKDLAELPPAKVADLAYIRQVIGECRPAWWDDVKKGKTKEFQQVVWKETVKVRYESAADVRMVDQKADGGASFGLSWPAAEMDSPAPMPLVDLGEDTVANFGLRKRDGTGAAIWSLLGKAGLLAQIGEKAANLKGGEQKQFDSYAAFRSDLTAAYYGTPPVRRLMLMRSYLAGGPKNDSIPGKVGLQPLMSALALDAVLHRPEYTHLHILETSFLDTAGDSRAQETTLQIPMGTLLLDRRLTFAEDRHVREMIKGLAAANRDWQSSQLSLGNNLAYELDTVKDIPLAKARVAALQSGKAPAK